MGEGILLWTISHSTHAQTAIPQVHNVCMYEQSTNHISLTNRPQCYVKSPTAQNAFQSISASRVHMYALVAWSSTARLFGGLVANLPCCLESMLAFVHVNRQS